LNTTFTDDPLMPGVTAVKAVHITELRSRIDSLRAANGLAAYGWTDPTLSPDETVIRAVHILDLREALRQVYVALGQPAPAYDDPGLAPGTTVRAVHIQQLRTYVGAIE
jgi:hypothetical protein